MIELQLNLLFPTEILECMIVHSSGIVERWVNMTDVRITKRAATATAPQQWVGVQGRRKHPHMPSLSIRLYRL